MMKSTYAIVLTVLFPLATAARPAIAQAAPLPAEVTRTVDILVGQDKAGPYPLAWKNIRAEGVEVIVDGATLAPADYTLDAAAGTVTFRTALKNKSIARVDYGYEPNKAQRSAAGFNFQPVTVSLFNRGGERNSVGLQVTALPGAANSPLMVWGLSGKTNLLGGGLSSELFLSPDTQGNDNGALADRAGMRLGYALATDRTKIDLSFARAGEGFAPGAGKAFSLAEPSERWSLAAQATPTNWLSGEFKLLGTRDLAGKNGATDGSRLALRLFGTGGAPALSFARTEDNKQAANGASTAVTTDTASLAGKSGLTTFQLQGQRIATDAANGDSTKENVALTVATASMDKKMQATVAVSGGNVETAKGVDASGKIEVTAKMQAAPGLSVSAEARKTENESRPAEDGAEAWSTEVTAGKVNVAAQLGSAALTVQGQHVVTEGSAPEANKTQQDVSLALSAVSKDKKALASVSLTSGTVETEAGVEARQGVEIKLQPTSLLTLSAESRLQTTTPAEGDFGVGKQSLLQTARAELRPVRDTVLTGALRLQGNGEERASVTDLKAQTQIGGRFLLLTGGWTAREDTGAATTLLDTTRVRMTLRPLSGISFTGGLTVNPEEKNGAVTEAMRQEYGLAARVGALDLSGGYALTTLTDTAILPVGVGPQSGELSLSLGLRFSRYTQLTGGYKDAFLWGGLETRGERAMSVGLKHDGGSAFNLSLSGTRTEDKAEIGKPADLKADIKMGLKF